MKTTSTKILIFLFFIISLFSCNKKDTIAPAPELPPIESILIDFDDLDPYKSAETGKINWIYSATTVGFWSALLGGTLAIPIAAFHTAIEHQPVRIDNQTWQWQFDVEGFASASFYNAKLIGKIQSTQVKWEMYISKTGANAYDEFLWFEGTTELDGNSGQWIMYYNNDYQDKFLQIDWEKEGDKVGSVEYTYVREKDDQNEDDVYYGSTLTYGLQKVGFDAYVDVHVYDQRESGFIDTRIEWSRTYKTGRIMSEFFYNDTNWHCWDSLGNDIDCN